MDTKIFLNYLIFSVTFSCKHVYSLSNDELNLEARRQKTSD
uniref:Uncharacterized protein n=1 Tax=Anguilla anguilla TaxID=7936 RepID=A0A0E9UE90_ANGAN